MEKRTSKQTFSILDVIAVHVTYAICQRTWIKLRSTTTATATTTVALVVVVVVGSKTVVVDYSSSCSCRVVVVVVVVVDLNSHNTALLKELTFDVECPL